MVPALLLALSTALLAAPAASQVSQRRAPSMGSARIEARSFHGGDRDSRRDRGHDRRRGGEVRARQTPRYSNAHGYTAPRRVWVPGHYEWRHQDVWVEGRRHREWVEPRFETRVVFDLFGGCSNVRVQVRAGYWNEVCDPGRYERRRTQVWIAGCWKYRD
jgi:hypothetical protein